MSASLAPGRGAGRELGRFLEIQNLGLNLPFAVAFVLVAAGGYPPLVPLLLLLVAFVAARNAGHSFNRWADLRYDRLNPRTQDRALVSGRYAPRTALLLTAASSALVVVASYFLNPLALALSPVALALVLGYSYTKRFTALTTVFLGLVEAITPAAAFIGLLGRLPPGVLWAVVGVLAWATAFETVHSLGDLESDRALGLRSLPLVLGPRAAVTLVGALHAVALILLGLFGWVEGLALPYFVGLSIVSLLAAILDLRLARRPGEVTRPFRLHVLLGAIYLIGVVLAVYLPGG